MTVMQGCSYSCVVATPDSRALYAVGSDRKLKELEDTAGTGTQITKEVDTGCELTSIALPTGAFLHVVPDAVGSMHLCIEAKHSIFSLRLFA